MRLSAVVFGMAIAFCTIHLGEGDWITAALDAAIAAYLWWRFRDSDDLAQESRRVPVQPKTMGGSEGS